MLGKEIIDGLIIDSKDVWTENFFPIEEEFNRCCFAIAFETIRKLNLFQNKGDSETFETISEKIKLFEDAKYVMKHLLQILCDEAVLKKEDDKYTCIDNEPYIETAAESLVIATRKFPEEGASFQWLSRAYSGLFEFIKGKLYGEEVMFPMGSFKLVEEVYNTSNVYGFYSRLAGKSVKRIINENFKGDITLLEIGAGTGNGTDNVLTQIDDKFEKYIFTDVSKALVQIGQRRFKKRGYGFLEYSELNIDKDPIEQGFGKVDVVLAVNALHATDDIVLALKNTKKLLKNDGMLILSEIAPPLNDMYRYMELTFGLLKSYNSYKDIDIRPLYPIIRPEQWEEAFKKAGFSEVESIPGNKIKDVDRGGLVIGIK